MPTELRRGPEIAPEVLRLFASGEAVNGQTNAPGRQLAVEWAGSQRGHPSTYGLLGATADETGPSLRLNPPSGGVVGSACGESDNVYFGLPEEYRSSVTGAAMEITVAAHGVQSSSVWVFDRLVRMLNAGFAGGGWPSDPQSQWAMWDGTVI